MQWYSCARYKAPGPLVMLADQMIRGMSLMLCWFVVNFNLCYNWTIRDGYFISVMHPPLYCHWHLFIIPCVKNPLYFHCCLFVRFIGEESVAGGHKCEWTDDPTWIIDPIDGTSNFVHSIPQTCVCIGLSVQKQVRYAQDRWNVSAADLEGGGSWVRTLPPWIFWFRACV